MTEPITPATLRALADAHFEIYRDEEGVLAEHECAVITALREAATSLETLKQQVEDLSRVGDSQYAAPLATASENEAIR